MPQSSLVHWHIPLHRGIVFRVSGKPLHRQQRHHTGALGRQVWILRHFIQDSELLYFWWRLRIRSPSSITIHQPIEVLVLLPHMLDSVTDGFTWKV